MRESCVDGSLCPRNLERASTQGALTGTIFVYYRIMMSKKMTWLRISRLRTNGAKSDENRLTATLLATFSGSINGRRALHQSVYYDRQT